MRKNNKNLQGYKRKKQVAKNDESSQYHSFSEVSMHVLARQLSPRTIRVKGKIGNHYVQILIDSGSTHNFKQEKIV